MAIGVQVSPVQVPNRHRDNSRLKHIVEDAAPTLVITTSKFRENVEHLLEDCRQQSIPIINLDECRNGKLTTDEFRQLAEQIKPNDLALLQYTSGSTQLPRGVQISHANLMDNLQRICDCFQHTKNSEGVIWLPPHHDMGLIGGILQPLFVGFPVTLMTPTSFLKRPAQWLQAITQFQATTSGGPNFAYDYCLRRCSDEDLEKLDLSSWEVAFNGAEPIREKTIDQFSQRFTSAGFKRSAFLTCYGLAEASLIVTSSRKSDLPSSLTLDRDALRKNCVLITNNDVSKSQLIVSSGSMIDNTQVEIVNPKTCNPSNESEIGEVWIRGPSVAQGYKNSNQHSLIFNQKIQKGKTISENGWLRSGDLGFIHENELYITGRLKDLIIIRGNNYAPNEIEHIVESTDSLFLPSSSAAFTLDNQNLIILTECSHRNLDNNKLAELIEKAFSAVSIQFGLQIFELVLVKQYSLPKTPSGKVQRQKCREQYEQQALRVIYSSKTIFLNSSSLDSHQDKNSNDIGLIHEIQQWIINWLAERLQINNKQLDAHHAFADLGVDSVVAVELASALEQKYSLSKNSHEDMLGPEVAWNYPTINSLSHLVADLVQQQFKANLESNQDNIDWEQALLTELQQGSNVNDRAKYD